MIEIGKTLVSLDIIEKKFLCDISKCKGICCVDGDSGAPLTTKEAKLIEELFPEFESYLPEKNLEEIKKQGYSLIDSDGDLVTPIIGNSECVYTFVDSNGITKCAIEQAYLDKRISFKKPISCHLFPVRITEYKRFDAVNYQELKICKSACIHGKENKVPLWKFLKEPLTLKYGKSWYKELTVAAEQYSPEL
jgi:hypothetical protein